MIRPGEVDLIARYFAPIADPAGLGLKDDAACLAPTPGHDLVVTVDALVEGVHFLQGDPPGSIARKALGVNVSDLAAKGADPPRISACARSSGRLDDRLAVRLRRRPRRAAGDFGCPLLGGDTVRAAGPLTLSVTALGEVPRGRMVRRTTARPGDAICVTGTIGDAALGLDLRGSPAWSDEPFLRTAGRSSERCLSPAAPRARGDPAGTRGEAHGRLGRPRR